MSFQNPPKSARPLVRWWWPGVDVDEEELRREVAELDEKGFYGAEIQAFWLGLPMEMMTDDPDRFRRCHRFMQPYYYEMVASVLDECAKRGMIADITVCSAWPAGGVHVPQADSMQVMLSGAAVVEGNTRYSGKVPDFFKPSFYDFEKEFFPKLFGLDESTLELKREEMKLFRVLAARAVGNGGAYSPDPKAPVLIDIDTIVDLTDKVTGGSIEWDVPDGVWQLFAFYSGPAGASPLGDARERADGKSTVIDHLSAGPVRRFLEYHLGRGKAYFGSHFGKTLRAFFTDSLELANECFWTEGFLEQFRLLRGYDLAPYLPVVYVPNKDNSYRANKPGPAAPCFDFQGGLGRRIRHDVQQTISDLFTGGFAGTMAEWAEDNGLKSRMQAYGIRADTLKAWGLSHIPETETLYAGGVIDFLKLAGSAGVIYGKPIVSAEAMSWNNRDFMTTPLKLKVAADRLFVSGVNQLVFHGFPYRGEGFSYPGYRPFSSTALDKSVNFSSCFCREIPHWETMGKITAYVTRCQYVLQQGRTVCNVGIYYPLFNYGDLTPKYEEMVKGVLDETDTPLPPGAEAHDIEDGTTGLDGEALAHLRRQAALGDNLAAHGYYYVHVNEDALLHSDIQEGRVVLGSAGLEVLILPWLKRISLPLARRLHEMRRLGVKLLFIGAIPVNQPGFHRYIENDAEISAIMRPLAGERDCFLAAGNDAAGHIHEKLKVLPGLLFDGKAGCVQYIHKEWGGSDFYFLRYSQSRPRRIAVRFPLGDEARRVPFILDPWTGNAEEAAQYEILEDGIQMVFHFEAYASRMIEFRPGSPSAHITAGTHEAFREGDSLCACFDRKGSFDFRLGNGRTCTIGVERDAPEPVGLSPWRLKSQFRDARGRIGTVSLDLYKLRDWREIPELKYNSGKGVYRAEIPLDGGYFEENLSLFLDLGRVQDTAAVKVNGHALEPMVIPPYAADVTGLLRPGMNEIEVAVTTTLRNRLVGYAEAGEPEYANYKGRALMPAGLIGPVAIVPRWKRIVYRPDHPTKTRKERMRNGPEVSCQAWLRTDTQGHFQP